MQIVDFRLQVGGRGKILDFRLEIVDLGIRELGKKINWLPLRNHCEKCGKSGKSNCVSGLATLSRFSRLSGLSRILLTAYRSPITPVS